MATVEDYQVLAKFCRNDNLSTLLMGMQNGAATLKNSSAVYQKVKYNVTMWPCDLTPSYISKINIYVHSKICTQMFIGTFFIVAEKLKTI